MPREASLRARRMQEVTTLELVVLVLGVRRLPTARTLASMRVPVVAWRHRQHDHWFALRNNGYVRLTNWRGRRVGRRQMYCRRLWWLWTPLPLQMAVGRPSLQLLMSTTRQRTVALVAMVSTPSLR